MVSKTVTRSIRICKVLDKIAVVAFWGNFSVFKVNISCCKIFGLSVADPRIGNATKGLEKDKVKRTRLIA